MKVVLFCGGFGMRIREFSEKIPKPMVNIGYRPLLWHVMKYYSYFGHKDFILCLGYKGDMIKNYFLNYNECLSNDFVLTNGGKSIKLLNSDTDDWKITFVDTGLHSNLGQRLLNVKKYLEGEEVFLTNYSDGLTDLNLDSYIDNFMKNDKIACFLSVKPNLSVHHVTIENENHVTGIQHLTRAGIWLNGGYFIFKREIFDYIKYGEELVEEPFRRLIKNEKIMTQKHNGFWIGMDTFKDRQQLEENFTKGDAPWELWRKDINNKSDVMYEPGSSEKPCVG
jgi:glucose-1-phosphate cytidylyltransferase